MDPLSQWLGYPASHDRVLSMIGIAVHWTILQYVLGLSFMAFIAKLVYLRTRDGKWDKIALTITKGFIIVFAVGAATGTASEFGLVLLWPNLTEAAGRYIYFPLYAEVFAFLMEVIFIYMVWVGWRRLSPKTHAAIMLLAFLGAWFSAAMIVSVNSYMVAPTGIHAAFDPYKGWMYGEGYPKIELYVPGSIASALNVSALRGLGMQVLGAAGDGSVHVLMPSRIVGRLVYEAWNNYRVNDSVLKLVLSEGYANNTALLQTPVKTLVDSILVTTIRHIGVYSVTFKSPVYTASILHALGSALTVSGFTVMAAYALRLLSGKGDEEYRRYARTAFKYAAFFTVTAIALQGFVFGDLMGKAIAHSNPEKFAAMEGTTSQHLSISKLLHTQGLMKMLAYGDPKAMLPNYDAIPHDICQCRVAPDPLIKDCRPPILIHYIYYTKIGLALLLGLYALIAAYMVWRKGVASRLVMMLAVPAAVTAQLVSDMGWMTRELGRKPWTIYGVMTVDVAHTMNPPSTLVAALVASYLLIILGLLIYAVWRFLWVPGGEVE